MQKITEPRTAAALRALLVAVLCMPLWACSSSSSNSDDDERPSAFMVVGQSDYLGMYSNRAGTTDALGLGQPLGAVASDGENFYVADYSNNRVLGWSDVPASPDTLPDFVLGQVDFTSSTAGTGRNQMALPAHVSIGDGKLFVTDAGNNRVLVWSSLPTSNTPPDLVIGQSDFNGGEPGLAADRLSFPVWTRYEGGRLLISDQQNHRVLLWNSLPDTSGAAADVVIGQPDFISAESDDEDTGMTNPAGLWTDGYRLLVADSGNNRVLYWSQLPRSSGEAATYVVGQTDFARVTAGVSQSALRTPYGLASDGSRFYVADAGNNRVMEFDAFPISNGPLATDVYGQNSFTAMLKNDTDLDGETDDEASEQTLSAPTGVFLLNGVLYVTDRNNHRVLFFPG